MNSGYISRLANTVKRNSYSFIPNNYYLAQEADLGELRNFQESYFRLLPDTNGGGRSRAYLKLIVNGENLVRVENRGYSQSKEYNYQDGGKLRQFPDMEDGVARLPLLQKIIAHDMAIAKMIGEVDFALPVTLGLHQIRYTAAFQKPSYSSPAGLHKDDEDIVFIHLFNLSHNSIGGDNLIAKDRNSFIDVVRLVQPLDSLCVTKKYLHAVTPLGVQSPNGASFRDILLVTFNN